MLFLLSCCKIKMGTVEGIQLLLGAVVVCGTVTILSGLSLPDCHSGEACVTISGRIPGVLLLVLHRSVLGFLMRTSKAVELLLW